MACSGCLLRCAGGLGRMRSDHQNHPDILRSPHLDDDHADDADDHVDDCSGGRAVPGAGVTAG